MKSTEYTIRILFIYFCLSWFWWIVVIEGPLQDFRLKKNLISLGLKRFYWKPLRFQFVILPNCLWRDLVHPIYVPRGEGALPYKKGEGARRTVKRADLVPFEVVSLKTSAHREQGWRSVESARLSPMCPGFDSWTRRHTWAEFNLLLVLFLAPRVFSPGTPVFPSPQKPTFPNSNSIFTTTTTIFYSFTGRLIPWLRR